ncbi:hypothetical protein GOBAR_DD14895 [Gossypium barbadense]|nr:hypothetical protein GOBAR_DD14895 [Gossypium barbadense]
MASEKRCLYEVLGLFRDCSQDEIRFAYKKLALQRHPDKLVQSGLSQAEATAQFQELVHAYEVLSDPKERSWYDSHRSQILFADRNTSANSPVPDLFSFFSNTVYSGYSDSGRGFYKVYSDLFSKIYANEINFARKLGLGLDIVKEAPLMGNLESPYGQVTAFYNYWLGFSTVMDFVWVDEYDAMAGPNRKSRRVMEEENKKLRKKAKREYNETVRGLAEFVKKRDKRVIDMSERLARVKAYEEPEWAKVEEEEVDNWDEMDEKEREKEEFYCVACGKKFKSEKQWKNHEQSKKHKEKVAELRESILEAMVSGQKDKKNVSFKSEDMVSPTGFHVKDESDEGEFINYGNRKNRRRNRTGKKEKGKKNSNDAMKTDVNETKSKNKEASVSDRTLHGEEKQLVEDEGSSGEKDDKLGNGDKVSKQPTDRKGNTKKETNTKSNKSSKGKKAKLLAGEEYDIGIKMESSKQRII